MPPSGAQIRRCGGRGSDLMPRRACRLGSEGLQTDRPGFPPQCDSLPLPRWSLGQALSPFPASDLFSMEAGSCLRSANAEPGFFFSAVTWSW